MKAKLKFSAAAFTIGGLMVLVWARLALGAGSSRPLITAAIDEKSLVTAGNTRPEANAHNDRGPVAPQLAMDHILLQLRRPVEQEQAVEKYIDEVEDPNSPNFHHWLSPQEVGQRFGPAPQDVDTITNWLQAHGFTINRIYANRLVIDFSGNASQVQAAFHTQIHYFQVNGKMYVANASNPQIPAALAPAVVGVVSLNNFAPAPKPRPQPAFTFPSSNCGILTGSGTCLSVVPADLATIYDFNPLFSGGISGQGQTIVVVEESDVFTLSDWSAFRSTFGLSTAFPGGSVSQTHPGGCTDPGVNGADGEAILDAEWASAAAPSAAIQLAACADTLATRGELLALQNLLNAPGTPPAIVSNSYGVAEAIQGATVNAAINTLYQTAVLAGVSVFVASGDSAAAFADQGPAREGLESAASRGIAVNGAASTPYNVAVGGTDFGDSVTGTTSTYWGSSNGTNFGSALSYVPEIPWNDSCASGLVAGFFGFPTFGSSSLCNAGFLLNISGGSGGPSGCATGVPSTSSVVSGTCAGYKKPSWQSVLGNPSDGVRDVPDVSMFAADGIWDHGYIVCYSDTVNGGTSCSGAPSTWSIFGGTSVASPIMAAIQAMANQHAKSREGNPNPTYYTLAAKEYGASGSSSCNSSLGNKIGKSCIFHDVTAGDMDVPCTGSRDCFDSSVGFGVLSTSDSSFRPAYGATTGWDFATGIGTVDANNLVMSFGPSGPTPTPTSTPSNTPTATPTPTPIHTRTPTPSPTPTHTRTPTPSPTATPAGPIISSLPSVILVGANFTITGSHFTAGSVVNFFVATSGGPINAGPLKPAGTSTSTSLIVPVPATITLGEGFVVVQVINTDESFESSNLASTLLQGSAAAGIPSLTAVNGVGLAATSRNPSFAIDNVETVIVQGNVVKLGGTGFDTANGVAVDLFCACTGGKVGPFFVNPGDPGLSSTQISFTLPASGLKAPSTGPGSLVISNAGASHSYAVKSNAVSVPIGTRISISSITQSAGTITVNGAGFSTLSVINFFANTASGPQNLGGLGPGGALIPLTLINSNQFTFSRPAAALAGAAYIEAFNPPFVPFTSSGTGPTGAFTLP
jgi:hypothetical protein